MSRFITESPGSTETVLSDVGEEREHQFAKWGPQHHPDGTMLYGPFTDDMTYGDAAEFFRAQCDQHAAEGRVTWADILLEETFEALAESDLVRLRKELVQVSAVAVAWVEDIDSRGHQYADVADLGGEG